MTSSSVPSNEMTLSEALDHVKVMPGQGAEVLQALITLISDPDLAKRLRDGVTDLVHTGMGEDTPPTRTTSSTSSTSSKSS